MVGDVAKMGGSDLAQGGVAGRPLNGQFSVWYRSVSGKKAAQENQK